MMLRVNFQQSFNIYLSILTFVDAHDLQIINIHGFA